MFLHVSGGVAMFLVVLQCFWWCCNVSGGVAMYILVSFTLQQKNISVEKCKKYTRYTSEVVDD